MPAITIARSDGDVGEVSLFPASTLLLLRLQLAQIIVQTIEALLPVLLKVTHAMRLHACHRDHADLAT